MRVPERGKDWSDIEREAKVMPKTHPREYCQIRYTFYLASLLLCSNGAFAQTSNTELKSFPNSVVPLPQPTGPGQNVQAPTESTLNRVLTLRFSIQPKDQTELENRVAEGKTVSPKDLSTVYSGNPDDAHKL